jgi:hypothetical protein
VGGELAGEFRVGEKGAGPQAVPARSASRCFGISGTRPDRFTVSSDAVAGGVGPSEGGDRAAGFGAVGARGGGAAFGGETDGDYGFRFHLADCCTGFGRFWVCNGHRIVFSAG